MTPSCSPGDQNGGNYIMFPHASTGSQPNNDEFSLCSRNVMAQLITGKGQSPTSIGCFTGSYSVLCVYVCMYICMYVFVWEDQSVLYSSHSSNQLHNCTV